MDALIVYPENKEQLVALKAVMKAMKIFLSRRKMGLTNRVLTDLKVSLKQSDQGQLTPFTSIGIC